MLLLLTGYSYSARSIMSHCRIPGILHNRMLTLECRLVPFTRITGPVDVTSIMQGLPLRIHWNPECQFDFLLLPGSVASYSPISVDDHEQVSVLRRATSSNRRNSLLNNLKTLKKSNIYRADQKL
jgi:hypothetical protein